jgi:uncharacterized protein involved in exopolysaccharide biosynthesis
MSPLQVLSILWRRSWIVLLTFAATLIGSAGVMWLVPPRYDAVATASIDPGQTDPVTGLPIAGGAMRLLQGNLVNLVKSHRVAVMVVKRLNLMANPQLVAQFRQSNAVGRVDVTEWIADDLLSRLDASFPEGTNTLTLKYKASSGVQAAQVVNAFLAAFIDAWVDMKITSAQQTAQWFEPQTDKLRADLAGAREKLAKFQHDTQLLATTSTSDPESDPLQAVTVELSNAKTQLVKLQSHLQAIAANPGDRLTEVPGADNTVVTGLKSQLNSLNADIGRLRSEVGANNPRLMALVAARKSVESQLETEIANSRKQLTTRVAALKGQIADLEKARSAETQKMIDLQAQRAQLASLKQDVDFREQQLLNAAKSAGASRLQSQLSLSNISPLDTATPPVTPAFPKPFLVWAGGIGAGLALGVIFALLAESFDRRVRVVSDLEFAGQGAVLGTVLQGAPRRRLFARRRRKRVHRLPAKLKPVPVPAKPRA